MKAPKNREENKRFRADVLQKAERDITLQQVLREKCAKDVVFFIDTFCWTYDPRLSDPVIPFILYPKQEELINVLESSLARSQQGEKINLFIDKPRDVGATFTVMTWCLQKYMFGEFSARIGSRKEDYVDKRGESDTLFYKLDFNLERLPKWLLPYGYNENCRSSMLIKHPTMPNVIAGESANPNFGRGGRKSVTIFDELGFWDWARSSWESAGESTNFRIAMTTPPETGRDSHTYKLLSGQMGKIEVFEFDWTDVPSRDQAWLMQQRETKSDEEMGREVLKSYEGTTEGKVYATDFRLAKFTTVDYNPDLTTFVAWDFGLDMVAMLWLQKDFATNRLKLIDSYQNSNKSIDFYIPFITGVIKSGVEKPIHEYGTYELEKIDLHKTWQIVSLTHFGDPDVNKRALKDKESTADVLKKEAGIVIQSKDWAGRVWGDMKEPTLLSFRRLEINEMRNELFISAMRNAKYPKRRENSQSTSEPLKPVHDWTSHFRSAYEYFIDNEPTNESMSKVAHVHYASSAMPRNNLNPIHAVQGLPPELQDVDKRPKVAYTHIPRL